MVNHLDVIVAIGGMLLSVGAILVALGRWGAKLETLIESLRSDVGELKKASHTHGRLRLFSTMLAAFLFFMRS